MTLAHLVAALHEPRIAGSLDREICDVTADSRAVRPGSLFVAVRGEHSDGHAFIAAAVAAGAGAVVVEPADAAAVAGVTTIAVAQTRRALSALAASFYHDPSKEMRVIGVTGTNGKTTTTAMIEAILNAADMPAGRIGTLGARLGDLAWPLENTTPLPLELQRTLAALRARGAAAVAMEVSSHALALGRVDDVRFAIGVLTNVTRDHLDFHGTLEAYARSKRALFDRTEIAILNADDAYGRAWCAQLRDAGVRCITYGISEEADVRAQALVLGVRASSFTLDDREIDVRLPGRFNVSNALAALCVARALGVDDAVSAHALATLAPVPGRMEYLGDGELDVVVDYAHTPDALEHVLRALRETATRNVIAVFGCGGDRDRGKRPQMGRIATTLADRVIVTSDNPRSEDPQAIVDEILGGVSDPAHVRVELDRGAAIAEAIAGASRGDVVLVAGKGHETTQIIGTQSRHFDDRECVRAALAARVAEPAQ
ncbi:MAG TPA: UDP-N-acetylmuramoyl-L-alanyl-D-glutamate--2,6-diaminopimelate ligase [Candidatus Baltobacteraceae bacterium]